MYTPKEKTSMKKDCFFKKNNIHMIDYRDTELLKKFLNPHARIQTKRRTNVSSKMQRELANAVKRARFMALLPYVTR